MGPPVNQPFALPDEFTDDEDDGLEDGEVASDCGMGEDGQCQYAGTEECDECPMNEANDVLGEI